jgi:hypothetical protein
MGLTSLIFRDKFSVKADYDYIISIFKARLDENYFKGYIDKDETQLFYFSGVFRRPLSVNLPIIQINFQNKVDEHGKTIIKFKIVNFMLILFGIANASILLFSIVELDPYRPNKIPSEIPLIMLVFSYAFLFGIYLAELSCFKSEITLLEKFYAKRNSSDNIVDQGKEQGL